MPFSAENLLREIICGPLTYFLYYFSTKSPPQKKEKKKESFAHPKMSHIIRVEGNLQDVGDTKQRLKYYSRLDAGPGSENRRLDNFFFISL